MRRRGSFFLAEAAGMAGLIALFAWCLADSWRKWPDPVIDFGRELYLPWRMANGAILYRDIDDIYGPLSQFFNAAIFTVLGPSFMHLVAANLVILVGILAMTYLLFRRAWGAGAALAAVAVFIAVFAMAQYTRYGNHNYLAPYAHESTHGFFVCLVLVHVLLRWAERKSGAGSFLIGLLFGCTLVLKIEFALAAAVLIAATIGVRRGARVRDFALMAGGALLPMMIFILYFACFMPWSYAVIATGCGWLNAVTTTRFSTYNLQLYFLGLDRPWPHFCDESLATLWATLLVALIAAVAWLADKTSRRWLAILLAGLLTAGLLWIAADKITWLESGRALPGLMLIYLVACAISCRRETNLARLLIALLAAALLARMFLNGRVYHYGYYQAVLAAIMFPAVLMAELPGWIGVGRRGAAVIALGTLALLTPGVVALDSHSHSFYRDMTVPVGTGGDLFYASSRDRTGEFVDGVSGALRKGPRNETLLVLPEGVMINYLARLPNPLVPNCYYSIALADGRESAIVGQLAHHPPDNVVLISRPLFEFGIRRWGAEPGEGKQILDWIDANYQIEARAGGDPLDPYQSGTIVYTHRQE